MNKTQLQAVAVLAQESGAWMDGVHARERSAILSQKGGGYAKEVFLNWDFSRVCSYWL